MKIIYKLFVLYVILAILFLTYIIMSKKNVFKEAFTNTVLKINTLSRMRPKYRPSLVQPYNEKSFKKVKMTTKDLIASGGLGPQYTLSGLTGSNEKNDDLSPLVVVTRQNPSSCQKGKLYKGNTNVMMGENECSTSKYCKGCSSATFYKNTKRDTGFCKCL